MPSLGRGINSSWTSGRIHAASDGFNVSGNLELTLSSDFACLMSLLVLIKTALRRKARHKENGRFFSYSFTGNESLVG